MTKFNNDIFYIGIDDVKKTLKSDFYFGDKRAVSCNAYLIKGEKTALIDVVNEEFTDSYIQKTEEILPISNIDYLICNYTGNEYANSMKKILSLNPDIEIVGTVAAIKHIKELINIPFKEHIAKSGGELDIGEGKILKFIIAPNLPWPDTMLTYVPHNNILFSGRLFSSYCIKYSQKDMKEYFDNILSSFKPFVHKAAEKVSQLNINALCPANGPIITDNIETCLSDYLQWSKCEENIKKKAIIIYPNFYGSTASVAELIADKLTIRGFDTKKYSLSEQYKQAEDEINNADIIVFGTNTINKNASKDVLRLISEMNVLQAKGKHCFVFGSYGWGGEGLNLLHEYLKLLKLKVFEKPFGVWFNPSDENYQELDEYIDRFIKTTERDEK